MNKNHAAELRDLADEIQASPDPDRQLIGRALSRVSDALEHLFDAIGPQPHQAGSDGEPPPDSMRVQESYDQAKAVGALPPPPGFEEVPGQPGTYRRIP